MELKNNAKLMRITNKMVTRLGLYAVEDKIIDVAIKKMKDTVLSKFATRINLTMQSDIEVVTDIIKKYDKNFSHHIENGHDPKAAPVIVGDYFIKIRSNILVYVHGDNIKDTNYRDGRYEFILTIFGGGQQKFVKYIKNKIAAKRNDTFLIYNISAGENGYWSCSSAPAPSRPFDTLYFDGDIADQIKKHLDNWKASKDLFTKRGLVYKTGLLFHGTHGTGKSSLASAIANYLGYNLIIINSADFGKINISDVVDGINCDTDRYVVLLDEIDTIYTSRDNEDITEDQKNTTSKLLTFLDSVNSPTNCVIVATTNYIDRLGSDLKRNGRFDMILQIDNINHDTAMKMCKGFGLSERESEKLLGDGTEFNPAKLQGDILSVIKKTETISESEHEVCDNNNTQDISDSDNDTCDIKVDDVITVPLTSEQLHKNLDRIKNELF